MVSPLSKWFHSSVSFLYVRRSVGGIEPCVSSRDCVNIVLTEHVS